MAETTRFQRFIGGLLGENLEGMTEEQRRRLTREGTTSAILGMLSGSGLIGGLEAYGERRKKSAAEGETARRQAAAEALMPQVVGRLFGGPAGRLESLPGGEGGELTSRYRQDPRGAMAALYGSQAGRDLAQMAPDLAKLATEGTLGSIVGGSVVNRLTGKVTTPAKAPEAKTPVREVDLGGQVIVYFNDGTTQTFPKGMAPGARAAVGGGGAGGGAGGGGGESFGKEDATTLRKEATTQLSEYQKFGDAWGRVQEAAMNPSPANDIALIFAYMKILDPTSAVREGEFATAANAGSIPQRVWARYNKLIRGEELNAEQRNDFLSSAYGLVRSQHRNAQRIVDRYGNLAAGYGVNPKAVAENPLAWAIAPKVSNQQEFDRLAPGTLFEDSTTGKLKVKPR
jgi:hypothetical protein